MSDIPAPQIESGLSPKTPEKAVEFPKNPYKAKPAIQKAISQSILASSTVYEPAIQSIAQDLEETIANPVNQRDSFQESLILENQQLLSLLEDLGYLGTRTTEKNCASTIQLAKDNLDLLQKGLRTSFAPSVLSTMRHLMNMEGRPELQGARDFGRQFVYDNIPEMDRIINEGKKSWYDKEPYVEAVFCLVQNRDSTQNEQEMRKNDVEFLLRNFRSAVPFEKYETYIQTLLQLAPTPGEFEERMEDLLAGFIHDKNLDRRIAAREVIFSLLDVSEGLQKERGLSIAKKVLDSWGLDFDGVFYDAWMATDQQWGREKVAQNFVTMCQLEEPAAGQQGICKTLYEEFGIRDFLRYPIEMLRKQYEQRNDDSLPYGIVVYPRDDWNGAFYENKPVFDRLQKQLDDKYAVRVFEVDSTFGLGRALVKADRRYGRKHRISFAIVGGHGNVSSVQFGKSNKINKEDLQGYGAWRTREFFEPNPTIILVSCTTGAEGGIAQELSLRGATVIAPDAPTNIKDISVTLEKGKPQFAAEYYEEGSAKAYTGGELTRVK